MVFGFVARATPSHSGSNAPNQRGKEKTSSTARTIEIVCNFVARLGGPCTTRYAKPMPVAHLGARQSRQEAAAATPHLPPVQFEGDRIEPKLSQSPPPRRAPPPNAPPLLPMGDAGDREKEPRAAERT